MEKYIFNDEGNKAGYRGGFDGKDGLAKIAHLSVPVGLALDSTYHHIGGGSTSHKNNYEEFDIKHTIFDKLLNKVTSMTPLPKRYTRKMRT